MKKWTLTKGSTRVTLVYTSYDLYSLAQKTLADGAMRKSQNLIIYNQIKGQI